MCGDFLLNHRSMVFYRIFCCVCHFFTVFYFVVKNVLTLLAQQNTELAKAIELYRQSVQM